MGRTDGRAATTALLVMAGVFGLAPAAQTSGPEPDPRYDAKVELGRRLFMDPAASKFGATSCVSCHDPENGFSDSAIKSQDEQQLTVRHSQGLLDIADAPDAGFHWDAEFARVSDLVRARLGTPADSQGPAVARFASFVNSAIEGEHAIDATAARSALPGLASGGGYGPATTGPITPGIAGTKRGTRGMRFGAPGGRGFRATPAPDRTSVRRLAAHDLYDGAFKRAFGSAEPTMDRVAEAIEEYVLSLRSTEAPFDRYMDGDDDAISESAERGFHVFAGKANCASCHTVPLPGGARAFSDAQFHNTGVAFADAQRQLEELRGGAKSKAAKRLLALPNVDKGLSRIDLRKSSNGSFKTPNLRDVDKRARYMHDGSLTTLEEVIDYYAGGGTANKHLDPKIEKLDLTAQDKQDLVAFLKTLSGDARPGLGRLPEHRPSETHVTLRDVEGERLGGVKVTIRPTGDRLAGADKMPDPFTVTTFKSGKFRFPFPASTHVALEVEGYEIAGGRLIPDCARDVQFLAVPDDLVAIEMFDESGQNKRLPGTLDVNGVFGNESNEPVTFRRVRKLGDHHGIYAAHASEVADDAFRVGARINIRNRDSVLIQLHRGRRLLGSVDLRDTALFGAPQRGRGIGSDVAQELRKAIEVLMPVLAQPGGVRVPPDRPDRVDDAPPPPEDQG